MAATSVTSYNATPLRLTGPRRQRDYFFLTMECRLCVDCKRKINFPPCVFKLSSNKYFHFPLFVGSRYFLIKEALTLGRTRKVIPPHRGSKGGGWNPSPEFLICCSIPKRFSLKWKAFDLLNKIRYILWVVALLKACDVTNNGRHLGFYQELEIGLKPREMVIFCALHENNS